jgi:hemerythrin-like domain-containing protein
LLNGALVLAGSVGLRVNRLDGKPEGTKETRLMPRREPVLREPQYVITLAEKRAFEMRISNYLPAMAIQIGQKPSPTFAQPLELLSDCHRRVESFLRALILVGEQARGGALNAPQREALETALRYFREAAPKHTADEEESRFPRMREHGGELTRDAMNQLQALEADHVIAKDAHETVERLGQEWLKVGSLSPNLSDEMMARLRELHAIYERHIAIEDEQIFPLAGKVLNAATLDQVGREMASRRGQEFHAPMNLRRR